jgi:hypothetical protein
MDHNDTERPPGALPLLSAMQTWLPADVQAATLAATKDLNRNARQVYRIDARGQRVFEIDAQSAHNRPLLLRMHEAQEGAEVAFLALLRAGRLVAWGREGSPMAPLRRIPPDAWASLRLVHVTEGRARGPGVDLFGVQVAPAAEPAIPPAPAVSAPQQPPAAPTNDAVEWMHRAYAARPQPKRGDAIRDCMRATGATDRQARAALALVHDRPRRGRPRLP